MNAINLGNGDRQSFPPYWRALPVRRLIKPGQQGIKIGPFGSQLKLEFMEDGGSYKVYGQENVISSDFGQGDRFVGDEKFAELLPCEIRPGDVIVTMMGTAGRCAVVPAIAQRGIMDSHLLRLRTDSAVIMPEFMALLIDEAPYVKYQLLRAGKGSIMQGLNSSILKDLSIGVPPLDEQDRILDFLDRETGEIDAIIEKQRRLIELLEEERLALASHSVTKGLNRDVRLKPSGVAWIGDVPDHWTIVAAKWVSRVFVPQRNKPDLNTEGDGIPWITMEQMKWEEVGAPTLWVNSEAASVAGSRILPKGAVIASCVGNFGVSSINNEDVIINQQLQAFIPGHRIDAKFMRLCVVSAKGYFEEVGTAATLIYVNQQGFASLRLPCPALEEQEQIVECVSRSTKKLDDLALRATRAIDLLREHRSAVISATVTGQIDVRSYRPQEAAALCP
jgi:type I restriction enzyme S subunit